MLIARDYSRKSAAKVLLFFELTKRNTEKICVYAKNVVPLQSIFAKIVYLCGLKSVMLHNLLEKLKQSEIKGAKYQTTPH